VSEKTNELFYNLLESVDTEFSVTYDLKSVVGKNIEILYHLNELLNKLLTLEYDVKVEKIIKLIMSFIVYLQRNIEQEIYITKSEDFS